MGAPTPDVIVEAFGANAGGSYITLPIPVPSQIPTQVNKASFNDGFPPDTMIPEGAGGVAMLGQDMNGILYMLSAYCAALTGGQFWPYNATWSAANSGYAIGAIVSMASGKGFWINTSAGNTNNPDTSVALANGWVPLVCYDTQIVNVTSGTVILTGAQAAAPVIFIDGGLTGNVNIVFPPWRINWRIYNDTTNSNFSVTASAGEGTVVAIPQLGASGFTDVTVDQQNYLALVGVRGYGSFTATLTGMASSITGTLTWSINGNQVTLYNNGTELYGTSNSNDLQITGMPAFLFPLHAKLVATSVVNGNSNCAAALAINTSTSFQFQLGFVDGSFVEYSVNEFTTSGTKGLPAGWTQTYTLD